MSFPYILSNVFRLMTMRSFIHVSHKYPISAKKHCEAFHRAAPLMSNNKTKNTSVVYLLWKQTSPRRIPWDTLSPDEHKNFHSERFQSRWYVCGFYDAISQSCWKMRFFAHPALGMHRRPENLPPPIQGTEPLSESVWHRSRSHHMRDNISAAIFVHTAHDKHSHTDNSAIYTNFFIQCVHPQNRVHRTGKRAITELLDSGRGVLILAATRSP